MCGFLLNPADGAKRGVSDTLKAGTRNVGFGVFMTLLNYRQCQQ